MNFFPAVQYAGSILKKIGLEHPTLCDFLLFVWPPARVV